jgi:hypothetical protein
MNEDEMQALEPSAGDELERMLARYARVRLDPSPTQTRRTRAAVVEEAWRRHIAQVDGKVASSRSGSTSRAGRVERVPFATWRPRRVTLALVAAVLAGLLIGSSAFAASRAGGPLYEARLTVETLMLPSDPAARLNAQLAQAQARLADIVDATGRSDEGALTAAITAYEQSIDALGSDTTPSPQALQAVALHRAVLEELIASASGPSVHGLENALTRSSSVIERLNGGASNAGANGSGGSNPGTNGGSNAGGNGNGGSNAGGNGSGGSNPGTNGGPNAGGNGNGGSNPGTNGGSNAGGNGSGGSNAGTNPNASNNGAKPSGDPDHAARP